MAVQGAQVVGRVALLLRLVGRKPEGTSLAGLVRESGLTRPTVHRLLTSLAAEGLLEHDSNSGKWVLGPEVFLLGSVAAARFPMEDIARPSLRRLAAETGESAFFSIRRGNETVCVLREEGSFPVRSFVLHEGVRFPLGIASAGTAIMAFLPLEEQESLLADWPAHAGDFASGHPADVVRDNLEQTRLTGYSVNPGLILEGSWGMGAAVFDPQGRPAWALSLTGIEPRFRPDRQEFLGKLLLEEAHRMTARLQGI
ncbi:IclR family transcriptional regulator [Paenarthrobacter nicotinovorans]|uniref:IclR family transcriptional regulator n=1 Tax=Paenarthrobacter nicotinovorans TaxID=29320 RepID=UPI00166BC623|nr:IclR family transcriptional regulator [Paenarthrobacter nicotinovorans]MBP2394146.1 DNA-binding IclR family transcriptional regulator [Paenarthrobacter nicotinovorans]UKE99642.1 IclR family transcriptional regulator [Paenarthrobacter nicotinovorans]UKF04426.1 IclR family transcriptional regulator [Paenarthrobacter nicotinovorans]GGV44252.1 putative IclR-family regulatory protein [Paenarthrobacter nicotinovorans]